jgi:DNA-damage-inducible protein D
MEKQEITRLHKSFEDTVHTEGSLEFWYARDLQTLLEYTQWRNFELVIEKAKLACTNSNQQIQDHFADVSKMVEIGSETERYIPDVKLTRYACYLIAQNGDPRKTVIAFAQTYFALQTRKQELLEERLQLQERLQARERLTASETELSRNIYQRGVDQQGFGRIRSKGDQALFGGSNNTEAMKNKLGVPKGRALADFLPTVTIAAKNLATEITNHNVNKQNLQGERLITNEHITNNKNVRNLLGDSGIKPETLPPEEDLKKLERRVKSQEKQLAKQTKLLDKPQETDE